MQYTRLGATGLTVSRICLGCMSYGSTKWRHWVLEERDARPFYRRALDLGINFVDTADTYSLGLSEEITGRALREHLEAAVRAVDLTLSPEEIAELDAGYTPHNLAF